MKSMAVDKLDFMIFEKNQELYNKIRDEVITYSVRNNIEADIYHISGENQLQDMVALSKTVHIAFINADYGEPSLQAGSVIFKEDEDVLIAFYGNASSDLKPYFASRPVIYMDNEKESFLDVIKRLHNSLCERKRIFSWTNKNVRLFIPYNRIIYMQSYKGYVDIITSDSGNYHILGKLDAVEEKLQWNSFIRIHKSTIANSTHIRSMDRSSKSCLMSNDDTVYISKAHYKAVSDFLKEDEN